MSPLQDVLRQLIGQSVIILTVADPPNAQPLLFWVTINSVNDYLVTVTDPIAQVTYVVTIADILGMAYLPGTNIVLQRPACFDGECNCRERPVRRLFDTLIGSTVDVKLRQESVAVGVIVDRTGRGIAIGRQDIGGGELVNLAISLCGVTLVNPNSLQP